MAWRRTELLRESCRALLVLAAAFLVPASGTAADTAGVVDAEVELTPPRAITWSDFLGVNAHFLWFTPEQYMRQIELLQKLGLGWVRVDLHWALMEPKPGQFLFDALDRLVPALQQHGLRSVFYLTGSAPFDSGAPFWSRGSDQFPPPDPQPYARRIASLAKRYPAIDAWQVWNEENLPSNWMPRADPEGYARLLQVSSTAIHDAAPGRTVVIGGMAYFSQMPLRSGLMLEDLGKLGALGLGDVVDYHPYSLYPEGDDPSVHDFIDRCRQVNSSLRAARVPAIWASEWGWSSYAGPKEEQPVVGERGQADFVLRRLALMSALDFDRIFLFALSDLDTRAGLRDRSYGLLDLRGRPKPVYTALANFLAITGPRIEPAAAPQHTGGASGLFGIGWQRPDGAHLWMFWSAHGGRLHLANLHAASLCQPLIGRCNALGVAAGAADVPVTPALQILEWR